MYMVSTICKKFDIYTFFDDLQHKLSTVHVFLKFADIITSGDVSKDTGFQACHHGNIYNDLGQDLYLSNGL